MPAAISMNHRNQLRLLVFGLLLAISGCSDDGKVIWTAAVPSLDNRWIATAETRQWSGPGNAHVDTYVYLTRQNQPRSPVQVLGFSENNVEFPNQNAKVKMIWLNSLHLHVLYGKNFEIEFQAIKCSDVEITAEPGDAGAQPTAF